MKIVCMTCRNVLQPNNVPDMAVNTDRRQRAIALSMQTALCPFAGDDEKGAFEIVLKRRFEFQLPFNEGGQIFGVVTRPKHDCSVVRKPRFTVSVRRSECGSHTGVYFCRTPSGLGRHELLVRLRVAIHCSSIKLELQAKNPSISNPRYKGLLYYGGGANCVSYLGLLTPNSTATHSRESGQWCPVPLKYSYALISLNLRRWSCRLGGCLKSLKNSYHRVFRRLYIFAHFTLEKDTLKGHPV